jgi:hypothetical protein
MNVGEAGHGIQTAAADDSDFCLLQCDSLQGALSIREIFCRDPGGAERFNERKESV